MTLLADQRAALEPASAELLRRAAQEATDILAVASDEADALLARARRDAEAEVERARAAGAAQAEPVAAAELGRSRRTARSAMLGAELRTHDEIAGQIRSAVLGLRDEPGYPALRDRLAAMARRRAGPGAQVTEHPDGGVIARTGGVVVDCSLPRLADRAIEELGTRIAGLCGP